MIVAFVLFLAIRAMTRMQKKEEAKPSPLPKQEVLLEEIRDLLKQQKA
jgi:large conductance mechanosensitive channel